jgi:hypothetical protein
VGDGHEEGDLDWIPAARLNRAMAITENLRRFDMKRGDKARKGGDCE